MKGEPKNPQPTGNRWLQEVGYEAQPKDDSDGKVQTQSLPKRPRLLAKLASTFDKYPKTSAIVMAIITGVITAISTTISIKAMIEQEAANQSRNPQSGAESKTQINMVEIIIDNTRTRCTIFTKGTGIDSHNHRQGNVACGLVGAEKKSRLAQAKTGAFPETIQLSFTDERDQTRDCAMLIERSGKDFYAMVTCREPNDTQTEK